MTYLFTIEFHESVEQSFAVQENAQKAVKEKRQDEYTDEDKNKLNDILNTFSKE